MINGVELHFSENKHLKKEFEKHIGNILYDVARQCLDSSYSITPRTTGKMANTSMAKGVQTASYNDKYIGNYTDYAIYVWKMNADRTNWTTPGTTSKWFENTMKSKGATFILNAVSKELS